MVAYQKFQPFIDAVNEGQHINATDQLTVALTNVAPVATNAVLADLTEIVYTNLSPRNMTTTSSTQTGGLYKLAVAALILTATGPVDTFRYVVIYNSTGAGGPLICFADNGSGVTLANTEQFTITPDQVNGLYDMGV